MKKIIENIRNQPSHHRDRIIWIIAAVAAGLLLIIWLVVGNGRKLDSDESFFQSFSSGVEEGKDAIPLDLNTNSTTQP